MDFDLPEDLQALQRDVAAFADERVAPEAAENDRRHRFPREIIAEAGRRGLLGVSVPREYGGSARGNLGSSLVTEELSRACASTGVIVSVHNSLVCTPIQRFGSDDLRRRYLPKLASGEWLGAYALTEANAGSDAANQQTRAERRGDRYVLDGTKLWITSGDQADVFIVFARTSLPDPARKARGVTAFVVERSFKGVRPGKLEEKCGIRASSTTELILEGCEVPAENVLGEVDHGFKIAMDTLDGGRIGIASQALGIARACLDAAIDYATRHERGGRPLARNQGVQWRVAEMATALEASRWLVRRAAWLRDRGEPCSLAASMAKLHASTAANQAADQAVALLSTAGCSGDRPVERYFRDARITEIYEGTSEIQRLVIARQLLPRDRDE